MITELWAIVVVGDDGKEEGIAKYPMSDEVMLAVDTDARDKIVADARRCNGIWQKSLRLARFEMKGKATI